MSMFNWFSKNKAKPEEVTPEALQTQQALGKTRTGFLSKLGRLFTGKRQIDAAFLDELEEVLLTSDVGVETTVQIIENLEKRVSKEAYLSQDELHELLADEIAKLMPDIERPVATDLLLSGSSKPYVVLVVGVNGVGKTTTIGKLAHHYAQLGKKVVLGAGDTFRAAAVEQLTIWQNRAGVSIVSHGMNADPASVAFDAVKKAVEENADVVIIDTAGRLHNKVGLMNELSKIRRVIEKFKPDAPQEVLLVIDATTGQNAFEQAKQFSAATQVNTLAVTKLDGTAKGGVLIGVSHAYNLPVKYIGLGEKAEDLKLFNKYDFIKSIFVS
ncbi:MAG: signal recognition particle-docking protein FtsY [Flavobacteriaceae bacterium]|nr:signal recognition particle-docking protein FtsY [Flavobacteriaceae bacterium]PHX78064.1 MAG: signal recognition particle-docking protein FtsY [Flavobacteriales bacterium]